MDVTEGLDVVIIGGGQAGLAVAHELGALDIDSVVFERAAVGQSWRNRWDSFTLVTPNWTLDPPASLTPEPIPRATSRATRSSTTWRGMPRPRPRPCAKASR